MCRYRAKVSFVFCFGYLVYFKYLKMFSPMPPPEITNCIQMMLTLKASTAFDSLSIAITLPLITAPASLEKNPKAADQVLIEVLKHTVLGSWNQA